MDQIESVGADIYLGILGGGQLGAMTADAAHALGFKVIIWAQSDKEPALRLADQTIIGDFHNESALKEFLEYASFATLESENIPVGTIGRVEDRIPMHPKSSVILIASDRWREKRFLESIGIPIAPYTRVFTKTDAQAIDSEYLPGILKTCIGGYDGLGQKRIEHPSEVLPAYLELNQVSCVLESVVDFACEFSIIVARDVHGKMKAFPATENIHGGGILRQSLCPAPSLSEPVLWEARRLAMKIAFNLDVVGLLAVEMFLTKTGQILVNELAPRPHNSGHGTIEGCSVSQFTQHVRAVCGLPLLEPVSNTPWTMQNFIGISEAEARKYFDSFPGTDFFHWYGKDEVRKGRKMGHFTSLIPYKVQTT